MYRPFKEYITAQFQSWCDGCVPSFRALKSLAGGGGVTRRNRDKNGPSFFLILQHVTDRDLVSLIGGRAGGAWLSDWDTAETGYYSKLDPAGRSRFVEKLRHAPGQLIKEANEGTFSAGHLDSEIVMHELEVGDGGVPYEKIAGLNLNIPALRASIESFLGSAMTQSLADGDVPPMCAPNPGL